MLFTPLLSAWPFFCLILPNTRSENDINLPLALFPVLAGAAACASAVAVPAGHVVAVPGRELRGELPCGGLLLRLCAPHLRCRVAAHGGASARSLVRTRKCGSIAESDKPAASQHFLQAKGPALSSRVYNPLSRASRSDPLADVCAVQYLDGMGGRYLYVKRTTTVLINLAQLAALTSLGIFYYDLKQVQQLETHEIYV